jgi:hypothetical protein
MSIVVWVPLTGLPSGLPALTGVASGTPLPANAIAVPEGYDPADPDGLWDLFPTDQEATYAQSYTPIAVATPFNISEAVEGVTLSGGTVQVLTYSLAPVATAVTGVTLSGGTITQTMALDLPAAGVAVAGVAPELVAVAPVVIDLPAADSVADAVAPDVYALALVDMPTAQSEIGAVSPEVIGSPIVELPVVDAVVAGVTPEVTTPAPTTWSYIGAGSQTSVAAGDITPPIHASAQEGDLLIAHIAYRDTAAFTAPAGWTIHEQQSSGNTVDGDPTTAIGSGLIASCIRGGSDPSTTFTRTGGDVATSRITAWRPDAGAVEFVASSSATSSSNSTTVATAGLTTSGANQLLIAGYCGSDNFTVSAFRAETDPTTQSGSTVSTGGAISVLNTWVELYDNVSTTGADTALGMGRAVKSAAGVTGEIRATSAGSSRHVMLAAAFRAV